LRRIEVDELQCERGVAAEKEKRWCVAAPVPFLRLALPLETDKPE
jgi:hypothetical protein